MYDSQGYKGVLIAQEGWLVKWSILIYDISTKCTNITEIYSVSLSLSKQQMEVQCFAAW